MKQVGINTNPSAGVSGEVGPQVASGPSSAIVSGAGTAAANGTYTPRGTNDGKSYYNLTGQPASASLSVIVWSTAQGSWGILGAAGEFYYEGVADVAFPWLIVSWATVDGDDPPPTVTES